MIAFASSITKPDVYDRCAAPGIRRAAEPDSLVLSRPAIGSLAESYNAVIDAAAEIDGLEALVLLHQDTEIVDEDFCSKLREALSHPEVGLVGCVGSIGVRSIAWWEGSVTLASFLHRYAAHGGGDLPSFSWDWNEAPPYARVGEVDTLDGFLLGLSPWTIRNVRFDESLGSLHGYDFDFCLQVREGGRRIRTADVRAIHHHELTPFGESEGWVEAHVKVAEKWAGRVPGVGWAPGDWEERARRAEAERDAARVMAYANGLDAEARVIALQRGLDEATSSISWRLTAPLRIAGRFRTRARRRR